MCRRDLSDLPPLAAAPILQNEMHADVNVAAPVVPPPAASPSRMIDASNLNADSHVGSVNVAFSVDDPVEIPAGAAAAPAGY